MIDAAIFLLSLTGFALLLLAMQRHHQDWLGRKPSLMTGRALRLSGFTALSLAFIVAGTEFSWGYGALAWAGWLTIAAALVVVAHINRERIIGKARR